MNFVSSKTVSILQLKKVLLFVDHENVTFPKHEKIEVYISTDQLTYQDAFFHAEKFYKDRICCLVNNDVFGS